MKMADSQLLDKIAQLSDEELKAALEKHGENVGPITSSTRYLFERLLRKKEGKPDIGDALPNSVEGKGDGSTEDSGVGNNKENGGLALQPQKPEVHVFFGVFPPDNADVSSDPDFQLVHTDKMSCLAMMKKYRGSRFKAFRSYEEALQFAENGPEVAITQDTNGLDGNVNAERPSPFRGPKSQDLVKFRKSIEKDDVTYFTKCINENPRYLVSSGDTPAILQEGSRYNALHVACRNNRAQYAAEVLSTVSKVDFFQKLYPDDTLESSERRSAFLLDLYLNTPDKGLNETPLHFASKHGSLECVRILTSYPACNKGRRNKFGQTPSEIICSRVNSSTSKVREDIQCLLGEQFYIPLFRDDDHCLLPEIGRPWSPILASPTSPMTQDQLLMSSCSSSSPMSPISPSLRVRGYAGPMSPSQAETLYRCWKENAVSSPSRHSKGRVASLRLTDQDKGLERIGRDLAADQGISWNEYWEFLGDFANFRTEQGLQKLEVFLKDKYKKLMHERGQIDEEELAMKLNEEVRWEEEGQSPPEGEGEASVSKLNDSRVSKSSRSTMSELCQELEALRLNVSLSPQYEGSGFKSASSKFLENWKEKEERQERGQLEGTSQAEEDPASEQLSYIMKSIRVAARRLAEVLGDLAQDLQSSTVANFSVTKTIRTKLKPEILCLKNVVSKCCTKELKTELEFGFIHVLLAFKATETIQENLTSSDICTLAETLKVFVSHLNFIQVHSSDEEDAAKPDITLEEKKVACEHFSCVVKCLEKALNIAYNNCNSDMQDCVSENGLKVHLMQMGDCRCRWDIESEEHTHISEASSTPATTTKYGKAFNFLHQTLFSNNRKNSQEAQSQAKDEAKEAVVKKLTFDEDGEEVIEASLRIRQNGDISERLVNCTSSGAKEGQNTKAAVDEKGGYAGDNDSFETAPSSVDEDMVTPEEGIKVYMHGLEASKVDVDVMAALGDMRINDEKFPHLAQWYYLMSSHSPAERNSWASPYYCRSRRASTSFSTLSKLTDPNTPDSRRRSFVDAATPRILFA